MTGTSERARSARRKSRPLPSGSTRSRMMRSASALRRSASRSAAASSIANPSRRSAKARLSRMAGSSSTTRTTGTDLLLRRSAEYGGRRRRRGGPRRAAALTSGAGRRRRRGGPRRAAALTSGAGRLRLGAVLRRSRRRRWLSLLAPLGHGQRELVVARLDDPQPDRGAQRGAQRRQARMLDEEPLAIARTRHELAQLLVLLELPHPVLRVERLPAPVHEVRADGLVGRAR